MTPSQRRIRKRQSHSPHRVVVLLTLLASTTLLALSQNPDEPLTPTPAALQQPYRYLGMDRYVAAQMLSATTTLSGNIVLDNATHQVLLEAEQGLIHHVDIAFKETQPCDPSAGLKAEPLLEAAGIDRDELELTVKQDRFHTYSAPAQRISVSVACHIAGGPLSVGISAL